MVYIGKTYNLWYKVIEQLEDICNCLHHDRKDVSFTNILNSCNVNVIFICKHNTFYF